MSTNGSTPKPDPGIVLNISMRVPTEGEDAAIVCIGKKMIRPDGQVALSFGTDSLLLFQCDQCGTDLLGDSRIERLSCPFCDALICH